MYRPKAVSAPHCEASVRAPTSVRSGQLARSWATISAIDGVVRTVVRSFAFVVYFLLLPCETVVFGLGGGAPRDVAGPGATGIAGDLDVRVYEASDNDAPVETIASSAMYAPSQLAPCIVCGIADSYASVIDHANVTSPLLPP
jgi:hypothetical protein